MLSIAIRDSNTFYVDALRTILKQHFNARNTQVIFTEPDCKLVARADLVFQEVDHDIHSLGALPFFGRHFMGVIFPICESEINLGHTHTGTQVLPIIYRQDSPSVVINKVSRQLSRLHKSNMQPYEKFMQKQGDIGDKYWLTSKEIEVLRLINQEYCLTAIANILNKNVKTVFSQKKSAMNKLNITSNLGLYTFLRSHWKLLELVS
ncbi:LuxR C-terminal-related transcriptional regulator [Serratia sp. D1N4]